MAIITMKTFEAGVHFGHQTRRWNPKMAPIFSLREMVFISLIFRKQLENLKRHNFIRLPQKENRFSL